jgi:outer membrane autotransporter protein
MIVFPARRHALAVALVTASTMPASAVEFPFGILVESGSALSLAPGDTVSVSGSATGRAVTVAPRASFDTTGAIIGNATRGNRAGRAYGLLAFDGSYSEMQGGSLDVPGDRAVAVQLQGDSRGVFRDVGIASAGADSLGVAAMESAAIDGSGVHIGMTGADSTAVLAYGEGASLRGRWHIDHVGTASARGRARAILVREGGHVDLDESEVLTRQADVGAVVVEGVGSTFVARRSRLVARGARAWAVAGTGGDVRLHATRVEGAGGAFSSRLPGEGTLRVHLLEGSQATGHVESGDTSLQLRMEDSELVGDMRRHGTGQLDAGLTRSRWTGRATGVDRLRLEASAWFLGGDADVGQLTLAGATTTVTFVDAGAGFASLRVGRLDSRGSDATVHLRTRLDAGGPVARQGTDRLLVEGDALGTTRLGIVATGGNGAATVPGPAGGISVAQVGGAASPASFRLDGDYVVVGPWRYGLNAYAPGEAATSQRRVAGHGPDYWDFRLQSVRVDQNGVPGVFSRRLPPDTTDTAPLPRDRAALAPQVPTYLALAGALFGYARTSLQAMHPDDLAAGHDAALRVRGFGGHMRYRSTLPFDRFGVDSTRSVAGVQMAGDVVVVESDASHTRAGVVASIGRAHVVPRAVDGHGAGRSDSRGMALMYVVRGDAGWRVDAVYAASHHRIAVRSQPRGESLARLRANGNDASLAGAWRWSPMPYLAVAPGASLLWQRQRFSSARDRDGIVVRLGAPERLTLRSGVRAALTAEPHGTTVSAWSTYLDARYAVTRDTGARAVLSGTRFATGEAGRHVELAAGLSAELRRDLTLSADMARRIAVGGSGESGLALRMGAAMTF